MKHTQILRENLDIFNAVLFNFLVWILLWRNEEGKTTIPPEALEKLAELYYVEEYDLMQDDKSNLQPSLVYAYRKQDGETDFKAIAKFHRIVKNYTLMSNEIGK